MSKKDVFDKAAYAAGLVASTKQLEQGVKYNDTASILDNTAGRKQAANRLL